MIIMNKKIVEQLKKIAENEGYEKIIL